MIPSGIILFSCQSGSQGGRFLIFTCQNPQKWKLIEVEGYKTNYRCSKIFCQSGFVDKIPRGIISGDGDEKKLISYQRDLSHPIGQIKKQSSSGPLTRIAFSVLN